MYMGEFVMANWQKRTSQKTGSHTRIRKTRNSNGKTTFSKSSKYGNEPRVTHSFSYSPNGKASERIYLTEYNNALGFKTTLFGSKSKKKSTVRSKSSTTGNLIGGFILLLIVLGIFILF